MADVPPKSLASVDYAHIPDATALPLHRKELRLRDLHVKDSIGCGNGRAHRV
jgi:hypothetical protein